MIVQQQQQKRDATKEQQKHVLDIIQPLLVEKAPKQYALRLDHHSLDAISQLSNSIQNQQQISNVISLVLYNCHLTSFEVLAPFIFPQLRSAQLHVNKLTSFDISQLGSENLAFLDLSVNELIQLEGFRQETCKYLKFLNLKKNKLQSLKPFQGLSFPSLKQLILSSNSIRTINQLGTLQFQQLTVLELGNNRITSLQNLCQTNLSTLTRLCLNHNLISNLRSVSKCYMPELKHLDLSGNFISELAPIQKLSLKEGKITSLIISFNIMADTSTLAKLIRKRNLKYEYFHFVAQCTQIIQNGVIFQQFQDAK